jgi:regulator of cell morphogenesis and NO signaling
MATASQSIGEIVATQPSAAAILKRFEIDPSSHACQSLTQTCADLQLSVDQVLEKLAAAEFGENGAPVVDPSTMSLQKLIQHIVRLHHRSVRQQLPPLVALARQLASQRGEGVPQLMAIEQLMDDLQGELIAHIEKEENVLFPYIAYLDQPAGAVPSGSKCFRRVSQPVQMMMHDHESASHILGELNRLTNEFEPPAPAGAAYLSFRSELRAFEDDLKRHVRLEDEFLFPRAVELEGHGNAQIAG